MGWASGVLPKRRLVYAAMMDAAVGVGSAIHKAAQVKGDQHGMGISSIDGGNADPIHVLAAVLEDQVGITFGLPFKGRRAGVGVDPVNIGVPAGIAHVEVAIRVKTDVLPEVAAVRAAKITNIRCLAGGRSNGVKAALGGAEQHAVVRIESDGFNARAAQRGHRSNVAGRAVKRHQGRAIVGQAIQGAVRGVGNVVVKRRAQIGNLSEGAVHQVDDAETVVAGVELNGINVVLRPR